ncbi:MAG: hypothetical protein FWH36_05840 [Lentimicrobiaceae bacterium]|nr:hypothetical protein [Lentimicrobiaceae bacterium]
MSNKKLFSVIFVVGLLFFACEKYEGTISGNVVFVEDGVEYTAVDAVITKIELKGSREVIVAKEKTDTLGNYVLNYTAKGSWKVSGRLEIDSLVYEGSTDVITIDGTNKEEQNIVLMPIKK